MKLISIAAVGLLGGPSLVMTAIPAFSALNRLNTLRIQPVSAQALMSSTAEVQLAENVDGDAHADDHKKKETPHDKEKANHHDEAGHKHNEDEGKDHSGEQHEGHKDHDDHKDHRDHKGHSKSNATNIGHKETSSVDKEHGDHAEHGEGVKLTPEQMQEFGVATASAVAGPISTTIIRPAEVKYNEALLAHVVPRVAGIVATVHIAEGENVTEGQVVATLNSRELADAKAGYLAAIERNALAKSVFDREQTLQRKNITSEKAFLAAKTALAETRISMRASKQKLHALGFDQEAIEKFTKAGEANFTLYTMRAPLTGTVVQRHLVRGESVSTNRDAFTIADVSSVWVDISIYPRDLVSVKAGLPVHIRTDAGLEVPGSISFVTPNLSEKTRTAVARVVLENKDMSLRPGMFVRGEIHIEQQNATVRVPKVSLQTHEGKDVVFVAENGIFEARQVRLGKRDSEFVEVVSGLTAGETIVSQGAFLIKSQLSKASFGDGHNH